MPLTWAADTPSRPANSFWFSPPGGAAMLAHINENSASLSPRCAAYRPSRLRICRPHAQSLSDNSIHRSAEHSDFAAALCASDTAVMSQTVVFPPDWVVRNVVTDVDGPQGACSSHRPPKRSDSPPPERRAAQIVRQRPVCVRGPLVRSPNHSAGGQFRLERLFAWWRSCQKDVEPEKDGL